MATNSVVRNLFGSRVLLQSLQKRQISTSLVRRVDGEVHPGYFKIKESQKAYQVDNGLKIHQRHGPMGKALYGLTLALCAVAAVDCVLFLYKMAYPPKNN